MVAPSLHELIPLLQLSIGPVVLISGIGLLLLSMTNRYGRTIDRSRVLARERRQACDHSALAVIEAQLSILGRRMVLIRGAITLASVSILLAALLVITIFLAALLRIEVAWAAALIFIGCMATLIGALAAFIRDIHQSLVALRLELSAR